MGRDLSEAARSLLEAHFDARPFELLALAEGRGDTLDLWRFYQRRTRNKLVVHFPLARQLFLIDQVCQKAAALAVEILREQEGEASVTAAATA